MNFIQAVILGVIEGFTEFLPISSTAHLILASKALAIPQDEFTKSFEILIQLGAILSVIVVYAKSLLVRSDVWAKVLTAFAPTAIIGFCLYGVVKEILFASTELILTALFVGGVFLIVFDKRHKESPEAVDDIAKISYHTAFVIGLCQSISIIPGISRAAATIIGGLLFGIKRKTIVEFSFLLAIPTMFAATGLDMLRTAPKYSVYQNVLLAVGFSTAFGVALLSVKFLLKYIQKHNFTVFGVYRIMLPVAWLLLNAQ